MKRIYLLRHGQTDWNKEGRIQGHLNVPLNETGRDEARRLEPVFKRLNIEVVLSSDLDRSIETGKLSLPGGPHLLDSRLRETHLGVLQGKTRSEIQKELGTEIWEVLRSRPLSDSDVIKLGTESGDQVFNRSLSAILDFSKQNDFKNAAIVTHGGVLRNLFRYLKIQEIISHPIPNAALFPFGWRPEEQDSIQFLEFNIHR